MSRVCLRCERTASDGNLLCQEPDCPAERAPQLLESGEWLGDIEVVRRLAVLRTSALYDARQGGYPVLLKVAHPDEPSVARLKREAHLLARMGAAPPGLPTLLPPYISTTTGAHPYGRAMLRGRLHIFCLWRYVPGAPLRDLLAERPQLWVYEVGWLLGDVAAAVAALQARDLVHYALCPEAILVSTGGPGGYPRAMLADLGVAAARPELAAVWRPGLQPPGYTAPELIGAGTPPASYTIDVYGLGLLLHELLAGAPAFPQGLSGDAAVLAAVRASRGLPTGRAADVPELAALAEAATSHDQASRPRNAADFAARLRAAVGTAPRAERGWLPPPRVLLGATIALLALAFLLAIVAGFVAPAA